ncbi:ABC transporter ATP-binding protein [Bacteriovoracaceae bacterium]|nr:ABC transporter ATP-binding protein [Bacteriovoracaceae bacterium]
MNASSSASIKNQDLKDTTRAKKLWFSFIVDHWKIYLLGFSSVLLTAFVQVLSTRIMGWILDFFASKDSFPFEFLYLKPRKDQFLFLFSILLGAKVFQMISRVGWRLTLGRQTHKASAQLRRDIWDSVRMFPVKDLNSRFTKGVLMSLSTSDVNSARFVYGFSLVALADFLFLGIFTLVTMFTINVSLSLWSLAVLLFLPPLIRYLSNAEIIRYGNAQKYLGEFNDLCSQVIATIRLQRVTQTGEFWRARMIEEADTYRHKRLDAVNTSLLYIPTMGATTIISLSVLFIIGIQYVLAGKMSIGDFVAMQGLVFLLQDPLFELGFIISDWKKGITSLTSLCEVYDNPQDRVLNADETIEVHNEKETLYVEGLKFQFEDSDTPLFENINLSLEKGKRLGILGPIGRGKSTLVDILCGLRRNHEGVVLFNGHRFKMLEHNQLRSIIGHVPQKPFLFAASIRDNIKIDKDLNDQQIWEYLKLACLDQDIKNFPDGLDTPLGEWGINLSGGQKQRLTLARALARAPEVLFLDDCLSAVDTLSEEKILSNLNRHLKGKTIIWVAHRQSTLKYCDEVLELG